MIKDIKQYTYEERLRRLKQSQTQILQFTNRQRNNKHIVYVVGNPSICGANKMIYEHANRLMKKGFKVSIVSYGDKPKWFPLNADYIQVPYGHKLSLWIPYCHVIVATYYTHIQECIEREIAPVVYFEQGDLHLYQYIELDEKDQYFIYKQLSLVQFVITVSQVIADLLQRVFNKNAVIIPNAVDSTYFYPDLSLLKKDNSIKPYLLMMGSGDILFKGIEEIIVFYNQIKKKHNNLLLYWITPYLPEMSLSQYVSKIIINPSQKQIGELMRNATALISASYFESFSLPVLEAMACGCPVISADNLGVCEYGKDEINLLLYSKGDIKHLADQCERLLFNKKLREKLILEGLKTAEKFKWEKTIEKLYDYFNIISRYEVFPRISSSGGFTKMIEIFNYAKELYDYEIYDEAIYFLNFYIQCEEEPIINRIEACRMRYKSYYFKGDIKKGRLFCFQTFELIKPSKEECEFISRTFQEERRSKEADFWNRMPKETI